MDDYKRTLKATFLVVSTVIVLLELLVLALIWTRIPNDLMRYTLTAGGLLFTLITLVRAVWRWRTLLLPIAERTNLNYGDR